MPKKRRLFCELSPTAYRISTLKCRALRHVGDFFSPVRFASVKCRQPLAYPVYFHRSLIRRRLGQVDPALQENKAVNLALCAPNVSHLLIRPGETFSFWRLAGRCTAEKGYREGLVIRQGAPARDIGGGMCQFTNLIHWMVLHTPLVITEHHHHDGVDLFPDFGRQLPFGCGTSILYNYLDYRFFNPTDAVFQLIASVDGEYLCGEIRADRPLEVRYHIRSENEFFSEEDGVVYRNNVIFRNTVDVKTGKLLRREMLKQNHARVLYDTSGLPVTRRVP